MRVFNEEMYFHFIGEVFLYSFLRICRGYLWLHMRVSVINLYTQESDTSIIGSAQVGIARGKVSRM
jgi:hypothetical protein